MTGRDRERRGPPYVSYRSWETFLDRLRTDVSPLPQRLDTSVWRRLNFSGSTESAIKSCLVFMGLASSEYQPGSWLERLVSASDDERRLILRALIEERYRPILGGIDLARATRGEVRDAFLRAGSGPETSDKAVSFFVSLAQDAGIEMHRQLTARSPMTRQRRRVSSARTRATRGGENSEKVMTNTSVLENVEKGAPLSGVHPSLRGLLSELPREGARWTARQKEGFQRAWNAVFDFVYATADDPEGPPD